MPDIVIVTDSTAQFPNPNFAGKNLVRILPFDIVLNGIRHNEGLDLRTSDFPLSARSTDDPKLIVPSPEGLAEFFSSLLRKYNELLVILSSADLSVAYQNAIDAIKLIQAGTAVQVVNSQTFSSGLGILVQHGAEIIARGANLIEADRQVRQLVPHVYTLICSPCLSYFHNNGAIEFHQATVGELLNLYPIFSMEEGNLNALCKVRNFRHAQDFFQEFIEEFDSLTHISLLKGTNSQGIDNRLLRQFVQEFFPETPFSEHRLNPFHATLFGPKSVGLIVVEKPYSLSG